MTVHQVIPGNIMASRHIVLNCVLQSSPVTIPRWFQDSLTSENDATVSECLSWSRYYEESMKMDLCITGYSDSMLKWRTCYLCKSASWGKTKPLTSGSCPADLGGDHPSEVSDVLCQHTNWTEGQSSPRVCFWEEKKTPVGVWEERWVGVWLISRGLKHLAFLLH